MGADLAASGNRAAESEILKILDSLPAEKAREMELLSMSYIPKTDETQFIRLKALQGNFPFYGKIKTDPVNAANSFRTGNNALVDESLMLEHGLLPGDSIKVGKVMFEIKGKLAGSIGSIGIASSVAPAIYINMTSLDSTGLVQPGSLINYAYYYKVPEDFNIEQWKDDHKIPLTSDNLRIESIKDRKENLNQAFSFLNYFLNLVAIVALLSVVLVSHHVLIYVKSKTNSIALLRCLGMKPWHAFLVYFIQISVLGVIGVIGGVFIGALIQSVLPLILQDFLPVKVNTELSSRAILEGFIVGLSVTTLFSLIPLIAIRRISPLRTLRASVDVLEERRDYLKYIIFGAIFLVLMVFLWILTSSIITALLFVTGIVGAYLFLAGLAVLIIKTLRKSIPTNAGFVFKQGLSNLFRPDNQTQTIMVTIGMGTAVLTTLLILQSLLLNNVSMMDAGKQPNMILYGIETNQIESLKKMTIDHKLPVIQQVPVVTMKIDGWKGKTKTQWLADSTMTSKRWAVNREARVSYRDTIADDEKLISGTFVSIQEEMTVFLCHLVLPLQKLWKLV
ncbi:MAG: FtsX-like permease family protein [Saprospiraceae bacterium]|nr:FtsX-like permease family protein [Saprospiraceae bacterium]